MATSKPRPDDGDGNPWNEDDDTRVPHEATAHGPADNDNDNDNGEASPLLAATADDGLIRDGVHVSQAFDEQETKSVGFLILLTLGIGGLQLAWSAELSNGSPYLLSLGLSKSLMALVWIAGPLTGTLVQPYIGILSDNCRLPMGKRKPFMIGGSVATVAGLFFLSWTKEIVETVLGIFGADAASQGVKTTVIVVAVIGIYVLDVAINTVQAAVRAFIVDCGPAHQQEAANAMASRLTGVGNIIGFIAGYVRLTGPLWFFGRTQFQILCAIASIALSASIFLSCWFIQERDPRNSPIAGTNPSLVAFFLSIFKSIKRLPPQVMRVCQVQFFGWVGFFPLLFYTSSYIGEIYVQPFLRENPHMSPKEIDELYEQATRIGSFALLVNAIVSLLTNVLLPFFIAPTYDKAPVGGRPGQRMEVKSPVDHLRIPGFTLKRAWFFSLILFSFTMLCTLVVTSVQGATVLIGIAGITWAMTLWAPYAIISAEISRRDALERANKLRRMHAADGMDLDPLDPDEEQDAAGVIMGIHNMSIAAPQIIANVGSSIIFKIWQKPRGTPGDKSLGIVLAMGGLFVLVAASFVTRIRDDTSAPPTTNTTRDEEH